MAENARWKVIDAALIRNQQQLSYLEEQLNNRISTIEGKFYEFREEIRKDMKIMRETLTRYASHSSNLINPEDESR